MSPFAPAARSHLWPRLLQPPRPLPRTGGETSAAIRPDPFQAAAMLQPENGVSETRNPHRTASVESFPPCDPLRFYRACPIILRTSANREHQSTASGAPPA